jgi:hypothetical protein
LVEQVAAVQVQPEPEEMHPVRPLGPVQQPVVAMEVQESLQRAMVTPA